MKKAFTIIAALFLCGNVFSQGIEFEHSTFSEVLAKAEKENKMVFMDCYTSWCGPCKQLAKNVFPQKEVGDYFNTQFINFKVDMEKGEGIELQKKYGVTTFPTLLFMDSSGKVFRKIQGGLDAAGLLVEAKAASGSIQLMDGLAKQYANGDRDPSFIYKYFEALRDAGNRDRIFEIGKDFIAQTPLDQFCNEDAFKIITIIGVEYKGKLYNHLLENKKKYIKVSDRKTYNNVIGGAIANHLNTIVENGTLEELKKEIENSKKDFVSPQQELFEESLITDYYLTHKEFNTWIDRMDKMADNALEENPQMAVSMYLQTATRVANDSVFEKAGVYGKAIHMLDKVLDLSKDILPAYFCKAKIYKKVGMKGEALKNVNTLIEKITQRGGTADATLEQLKSEIESMQ